jgi:hypothetical protein
VGVEELGGREQLDDPAREQPQAGDAEGADRGEPGQDQAVGATRLLVIGDRVGERRKRELEPPCDHGHSLGELDGERVEARLGKAREPCDQNPVDEVQRVERELGRHRRQAEAHHSAQDGPVGDEGEPAALPP